MIKKNYYKIKELNEIFNLVCEYHKLIEVKQYNFDEFLKYRKELYLFAVENVINIKDIDITKVWSKYFNYYLKYIDSDTMLLSDFLSYDKYISNNRNYNWIIHAKSTGSLSDVNNGYSLKLDTENIFINLSIQLSDFSYDSILNLLQLGYDYFNINIKDLLINEIEKEIERKQQSEIKSNVCSLVYLV